MTPLTLQVADVHAETATIRRLDLKAADAAALPGYTAGSHVTLHVPGVGARKYSLINASLIPNATAQPKSYCIGVRLEATGGGGSKSIHSLRPGDELTSDPPQNNFPLTSETRPVLLLGGGIGVTPLISMAAALAAEGRQFRMIYAARAAAEFAFLDEIRALAGDGLQLHADDAGGGVFDVATCFASLEPGTKVYACGPRAMLKACMAAQRAQGWPRDRLAFELFYSVSASP